MTQLSKGISDVIQILEKSPLIEGATIFGSLIDRPSEACDVDMAFVIDAPFSTQLLDKHRSLLKAGAYGTPRYGLFDLFLCFQDQTWVRNENCLGFTRAKNAKAILEAIKTHGKPWPQWRPSVVLHGQVEQQPAENTCACINSSSDAQKQTEPTLISLRMLQPTVPRVPRP